MKNEAMNHQMFYLAISLYVPDIYFHIIWYMIVTSKTRFHQAQAKADGKLRYYFQFRITNDILLTNILSTNVAQDGQRTYYY